MSSTLPIRRTSAKDAAALTRHVGDPAVFGRLMQMPYPSEEMWRVRLSDGACVDVHSMARLHPNPPAIVRHGANV